MPPCCPKGTVKVCQKIESPVKSPAKSSTKSSAKTAKKQKKCPKGTQRNKKTGECVPKTKISVKKSASKKKSPVKVPSNNFQKSPDKLYRIKVFRGKTQLSVLDLGNYETQDIGIRISEKFDIPEHNIDVFYDIESDEGFIVDRKDMIDGPTKEDIIKKLGNSQKFQVQNIGDDLATYTIVLEKI